MKQLEMDILERHLLLSFIETFVASKIALFPSESHFFISLCNKSKIFAFHRLYCFRLVNGKPFHQPAEFLPGQRPDFGCVAGPLELSVIQALLQKHKSIPVEVERFHCIFFTSTEQKDCIGEGIHLEVIPYDCHEAFKRLSHICAATDQVDFLYSGQITNQSSRRADMV